MALIRTASSTAPTVNSTRSWWWTRADVNFNALPVTVDIAVWPFVKSAGIFALAVVLPAMGNSLFSGFSDNWIAGLVGGLKAILIMTLAAAVILTVAALWCRRRITFYTHGVTVEWAGVFGMQSWALPYSAYDGVLYRQRTLHTHTTLQIIELYHEDPEKSVPLHVQDSSEAPREQWKAYARRLGLPAGILSGKEIVSQRPEDLDQTIGDWAREGAISAAPPPSPPPPGLAASPDTLDGDAAERITVTASRPGLRTFGIVIVVGVAAMIWVLSYLPSEATAGSIWWLWLFLAAMPFSLFFIFRSHFKKRRGVLVTADRLAIADETRPVDPIVFATPLRELEDIRLQPGGSGSRKVLFIANRGEQASFGDGLSVEALEWLRDYLIAAAARA